jgi:phage gpG-like protein
MVKQVTPDEFAAECDQLADSWCADLREPLEECAEILLTDNETNFRESISADGGKWPERKSGGNWPLLIKTGALMDAATRRGAQGNVVRNDGHSLEVGVEKQLQGPGGLPGAFVHQFGGDAWQNIPARPYVGASDDAQERCADTIGDFAQAQIFPD